MAYTECKRGYNWYVCSGRSPFRGCCRIDACNGGCPPGDLQPSDDYTTSAAISSTRTFITYTSSNNKGFSGTATSAPPSSLGDVLTSSTNTPGPSTATETSSYYSSSSHTATPTSSVVVATPTSSAPSRQSASSINIGGIVGGVVAFLVITCVVLLFFWLRKGKPAFWRRRANPYTSYSPPRWNGPQFINTIVNRFSAKAIPVDAQLQTQSPNQGRTELPGDSVHQTQLRPVAGYMAELPGESAPPRPNIYSLESDPEAVQRERVQYGYINQFPTHPARNSVTSLRDFPHPSTMMNHHNVSRPVSAHGYPRYSLSPVSPEVSESHYTPSFLGPSQGRQPIQDDWEARRGYGHSPVSPEIPQSGHMPTSPGPSEGRQPFRRDWAAQGGPERQWGGY